MTTSLEQLADALDTAQRVVVLTGAGASAGSGIPTFRDALTGHWAKFKPQELATPEAFAADPGRVTRWYDERRLSVLACEPNAGHEALAALEQLLQRRGGQLTILTQNVDALHQRAGSTDVVEVHGSLIRWRCTKSGQTQWLDKPEAQGSYPAPSPKGGRWRPDVVWFGESLPEQAMARVNQVCPACDVYMAVGTSGVVFPAAGFVEMARQAGAFTAELNPEQTDVTYAYDVHVAQKSDVCLPELVQMLQSRQGA